MKCSLCGGYSEWKGPLSNLTHSECSSCGGINCHESDEEEEGCDHEWKEVDDSFDHEFGVEKITYWQCENCEETTEEDPDPHPFQYE